MEEYGPTIKYIKGPDNDAADALNMIPLINSNTKESDITSETLSRIYCVVKTNILNDEYIPTGGKITDRKIKCASYHTKYFRGGRKVT